MTDHTPRTGGTRRAAALVMCLVGLGEMPVPATAWPEERAIGARRMHRVSRARPAPPAPPALVSGYLPRNHLVPMYNEPPRFRSP